MDRGALFDTRDGNHSTVLHKTASGGYIEVVKVLLNRGATIDVTTNNKRTGTALYWAADEGHIES